LRAGVARVRPMLHGRGAVGVADAVGVMLGVRVALMVGDMVALMLGDTEPVAATDAAAAAVARGEPNR